MRRGSGRAPLRRGLSKAGGQQWRSGAGGGEGMRPGSGTAVRAKARRWDSHPVITCSLSSAPPVHPCFGVWGVIVCGRAARGRQTDLQTDTERGRERRTQLRSPHASVSASLSFPFSLGLWEPYLFSGFLQLFMCVCSWAVCGCARVVQCGWRGLCGLWSPADPRLLPESSVGCAEGPFLSFIPLLLPS